MDVVAELERLSEMNRSGALTAEEFAAAKAVVLAGRPAVDTGFGAEAGSAGPGPRYDAPRSGSSVGVVIGVVCALVGLYWIVSALFVAGQAQSLVNTMPSGSFSGMPGGVTFTDPDGRPVTIDSPFDRVDSMQQQMTSSISQAAGLQAVFGLALVVAGIWLGRASRRRISGLQAATGADASSPIGPGDRRTDG